MEGFCILDGVLGERGLGGTIFDYGDFASSYIAVNIYSVPSNCFMSVQCTIAM